MNAGFDTQEYANRFARAQKLMTAKGIDALLLTTHPDFFYFTGFLTRFWESPTRPWFLILPQAGEAVAVIPGIGAPLMATTHVRDIRTWSAPDLSDDGVSLLASALGEIAPGGMIGIPDGHETHLRMPLGDFERVKALAKSNRFGSDKGIVRTLRMAKSQAEIARIGDSCSVANRAFARVGGIAAPGIGLDRVFRDFQRLCLEEGADFVPYLAGGAGPAGYSDVISPASTKPLETGDILMLDTGLVRQGYFCDFDRNFAIGKPDIKMLDAHAKLHEATQAGFEAARPGATASDLFHAMDKVLTGGRASSDNGRLGHGLGIQLTEWPSLIPADHTALEEGFVLTLEPGIATRNGNMLVHEENIAITKNGARWLSEPSTGLAVIGAGA